LFCLGIIATSFGGCSVVLDFSECESDADCEFSCVEGVCEGPPTCAQRSDCAAQGEDAYCLSGTCRVIDRQKCPTLGQSFTTYADDVIIPIGAVMPLSGENAPKGEATLNGAELAIRQINAAAGGSRSGAKYGLIVCDTAYDPTTAADLTSYLHEDLGVQGVVGAISSAESIEIVDKVAREDEVLLISPASTAPALTGRSDYFWRTIASDADQASAMGTYLANEGLDDSVAVLYTGDTDPYGAGFLSALNTYWANNEAPDPRKVAAFDKTNPASGIEALNNSTLYGTNGINPKTIILIGPVNSLALLTALERDIISQLPSQDKPIWILPDALRDQALLNNSALVDVFPRIRGTIPARQDTMLFNNYKVLYETAYSSDPLRYQFPDKAYDAAYIIALAHESHADPLTATSQDLVATLKRLTGGQEQFEAIATSFSETASVLRDGRTISMQGVSGPIQFSTQRDLINPTIAFWTIDSSKSP
ncbi:unnamed protein product, partial [Laminaria digitata]